ncbi:SRPBCC family protein [Labrys neptuniae]
MIKALLWFAVILCSVFLVYYGGAFLLPDHVSVYRKVEIAKPPSAVFALVNDLKGFDQWWMFTNIGPSGKPNPRMPISGPSAGVGQKQIWLIPRGPNQGVGILGEIEIVESTPDRHVAMSVDVPDYLSGRWRFDLDGGTSTRIEWASDVALDTSFKRWVGYFFADSFIGKIEEVSLAQLKELAETGTITRPLPARPAGTASPQTAS